MPARRFLIGTTVFLLAGTVPGAGQGQSDRVLQQIERLIAGQRGLRIYDWVGFTVDGGQVTLVGVVTRPSLREDIARSVNALEAVGTVRNEIELLPRSGDDIGIRINAYWRIYGHPEIRRYLRESREVAYRLRRSRADVQRVLLQPIHIVVNDGHLILEGELEQHRERRVAEEQAYAVTGVRSVVNNIVVTGADSEEFGPIDFEKDPWWMDSGVDGEPVLRLENPAGGVRVQVANTDRVRVRRTSRTRPVRAGDTQMTRLGRKMRLRAQPSDGAVIDLEVDLPYGHRVEIETVDGPVSITGLIRAVTVETAIGRVELAVPWRGVHLDVRTEYRPLTVDIAPELRAIFPDRPIKTGNGVWTLPDIRDARENLYGSVRLNAKHPDALVLRSSDIPDDAPIRMHWQAPEALRTMLRRPFRMDLTNPGGEGPRPGAEPVVPYDGDVARFSSDVRLVQLSASVVDAGNRPVRGLQARDFELLEDGVPQKIGIVQSTESTFNLVLLLDCSTSTLTDRKAVLEAARQFVLATRPGDRVGIYVLSDTYVHIVSPLTPDREALLRKISRIPRLSGGTPLYDAITLSYAQELARRRWERNAIIVISDGMDNDLLPRWSRSIPSLVQFEDLVRVAAEMNSAVYPIFLEPEPPGLRTDRSWRQRMERSTDEARERMRKLATTTGGRLFRAETIRDLDDVYGQVAQELRSVYTLGYYPANQDFNGAWRRIRVQVGAEGAVVRTRPGYYGW